jgi:uncharacterized DUF497 family protein
MQFEFDPDKAAINHKKHGVHFSEAATCLLDEMALVHEDGDVAGEQRLVLVGMSAQARLLTVVYSLRGDTPRLISARKATTKEVKSYAQ